MGTRKNCLGEAALTSTHNLCFVQKYERYLSFLSEYFQFLETKFSIYLKKACFHEYSKKGKRKVQGVPQSQTAALLRPQEEGKTDKSQQAQTE